MAASIAMDSQKIEISWHGHGRAPVIVLLHQGLGCCALWKDFPDALARATGHRVFAYSRLGYGNSDPCPLPRKINFMHTEARYILPRVLKAVGIQEYILWGHSDGASIGIIHGGHGPPGLKGLILEAAHVFCEPVTLEGITRAKIAYEQGNLRKKLYTYHGKNTETAFRGWCDTWLSPPFIHWNIEKYLPRIQVKTLALQGKEDPYGSVAQLKTIEKRIPHCRAHHLPHCGHAPHREMPDRVIKGINGSIFT